MQMQGMKLGLLELGDVTMDTYDYGGLLEYVKAADRLGYHRMWFGEHYTANIHFNNPEPLLPLFLSLTQHIRIGPGGVLLKYHSPYRIASYYKILAALFPGRVELGICRPFIPAYMGQIIAGHTYQQDPDFRDRLQQLLDCLYGGKLEQNPAYISPPPLAKITLPALWMLSSTFQDIQTYPHSGLHYCRSLFHSSYALDQEEIGMLRSADKKTSLAVAIAVYCEASKAKRNAFLKMMQMRATAGAKVICCRPEEFPDIVGERLAHTHIKDIIIANMGNTYAEKIKIIHSLKQQYD